MKILRLDIRLCPRKQRYRPFWDIRFNDAREKNDDNYPTFDKLVSLVSQLCPMAMVKGRDDEARAGLISRAVVGTMLGLSALQEL